MNKKLPSLWIPNHLKNLQGIAFAENANEAADVGERRFESHHRFDAAFDGKAVDQLVHEADRHSGVSFLE